MLSQKPKKGKTFQEGQWTERRDCYFPFYLGYEQESSYLKEKQSCKELLKNLVT